MLSLIKIEVKKVTKVPLYKNCVQSPWDFSDKKKKKKKKKKLEIVCLF